MAQRPDPADCPACGTELSAEQGSQGLCPSCLVELAIELSPMSGDLEEDVAERTTRKGPDKADRGNL